MSLYHEAASILSSTEGGSLRSRVFGRGDLKSPAAQVYALTFESCKWSAVLKEVIDNTQLLQLERKLTPVLALLLVHDLLVSKSGIALPQSHGLRASVERHKARLAAELTRARIRRKAPTLDALRDRVEAEALAAAAKHPRWVRINTLRTTLDDQLESTFADFTRVRSIAGIILAITSSDPLLYVDADVPNLVAVSPQADLTSTEAYRAGDIILQDKASCFPAYMLDPSGEDGDIIDACAAPGNKTTHLAAILSARVPPHGTLTQTIHAFEKDKKRAQVLQDRVRLAGSHDYTTVHAGQDFLRVDPDDAAYREVGALLLDPSCSGSGIVGRDDMSELVLPTALDAQDASASSEPKGKGARGKRKRDENDTGDHEKPDTVMVDDDGTKTPVSSEKELETRLEALASFQLSLLLHAFKFPAARKITYSTCSRYRQENEEVVTKALQSDVARQRGWKVLARERQIRGMREWPVRGLAEGCGGDESLADACIRADRDDGRGVMGFFVAGFVREDPAGSAVADDGPYLRDENGRIVRDAAGLPTLKNGTRLAYAPEEDDPSEAQATGAGTSTDDDGPYLRDETGRIVRDADGMPTLKRSVLQEGQEEEAEEDEDADADAESAGSNDGSGWNGFDD